jgi:plastocyanin
MRRGFFSMVLAALLLAGCGEGEGHPGAHDPRDAGAGDAGDAAANGEHDAGDPDPEPDDGRFSLRCSREDFDRPIGPEGGDFTGEESVTITFPEGSSAQYTNRCAKVKLGTPVTWQGNFAFHPLAPAGGDEPSPIPTVYENPDGNALTVVMDRVGTFGFICAYHPLGMYGAVEVVP